MSNECAEHGESARKARFLGIKVHVKGEGRTFRLPLPPIALFALHDLLLSLTPLFSLFVGRYGHWAKAGLDSADALLLGFMASGPDEFANIDVRDGENFAKVRVRMF